MTESALARMPSLSRVIGPVVAANRRLASRYANVLRAGHAADAVELANCGLIVIQAPCEELAGLLSRVPTTHGVLAVLDDDFCGEPLASRLAASTPVCTFGFVPTGAQPVMLVEGQAAAVRAVRRWAAAGAVTCVELKPGAKALYASGIVTASALVTPMVDSALRCLRAAGLSQTESRRIVAYTLEGSLRSYEAHGRKGWPNPALPGRRAAVLAQRRALARLNPSLEALFSRTMEACLAYYGQDTSWLQ